MLNEQEVRNVMRDRLLSIAGLDGTSGGNVAFQNRPFTPPTPERGVFWVSESQEIVDETLNATELVEVNGFTIYRVYTSAGSSVEVSSSTSLAIVNAFRPGQTLRDVGGVPQDCGVVLWKSFRLSPFHDDDSDAWYIQPVQVNWRVHVSNPAVF